MNTNSKQDNTNNTISAFILKDIKAVASDVDGTLTESRCPLQKDMAMLLAKTLETKKILIITGGGIRQMETQFLNPLYNFFPEINQKEQSSCGINLKNLYLMPTSGAEFFSYAGQIKDTTQNTKKDTNSIWHKEYSYTLSDDECRKIANAIEKALKETGIGNELEKIKDQFVGEQIEFRGAQVTFSALGQEAPLTLKQTWDPKAEKRTRLKEIIDQDLPEFSVKIGGTTSLDITRKGIDKAFGINEFIKFTGIPAKSIAYLGDALYEGGNDSVVIPTGVNTVQVNGPEDSAEFLKNLL